MFINEFRALPIQLFILIHAFLGGIALLTGAGALLFKKGAKAHKVSGLLFYYSMLSSVIISIVVAHFPNHENLFLISIGFFSLYFLVSGYRSLRFKNLEANLLIDKTIAIGGLVVGIAMVFYPLLKGFLNPVSLSFGLLVLFFSIRDLRLFKDRKRLQKNWLKHHLGKMIGGYISAVSAFFVVNQILPGLWNWFSPGIVGGMIIYYWMSKLKRKDTTLR